MEIKALAKDIVNFLVNRIIEFLGIILILIGLLLFVALLTYSNEDPNFIFSNGNEINNFLGFRGSIVSDFFLQAVGLISFLISLTILCTGINIIIKKKLLIILESFFFTVIYSIIGSLFLTFFYNNSFWLSIKSYEILIGLL